MYKLPKAYCLTVYRGIIQADGIPYRHFQYRGIPIIPVYRASLSTASYFVGHRVSPSETVTMDRLLTIPFLEILTALTALPRPCILSTSYIPGEPPIGNPVIRPRRDWNCSGQQHVDVIASLLSTACVLAASSSTTTSRQIHIDENGISAFRRWRCKKMRQLCV